MAARKVRHYVLDERGDPRPEPSFPRWVEWCRQSKDSLLLASDVIEGGKSVYEVVTMFLCFDRAPENQPPLLFGTTIVALRGALLPGTDTRYATRHEAIVGHHDAIFYVKELQARTIVG